MPPKKERTLLMFHDRRRRISIWSGLLGFLFGLSLFLAIAAGLVFILGVFVYPIVMLILVLCTLFLILLTPGGIKWTMGEEFTGFMIPLITFLGASAVACYVLKYLVEWLAILNETRILKKRPEEYKHHIAVAGAVRKTKFFDAIICAVIIGLLVLAIYTANVFLGAGTENISLVEKAIPAIAIIGIFILLYVSRAHASKQFEIVHDNMKAIYDMRYQHLQSGLPNSMPATISVADLDPKMKKEPQPKPEEPTISPEAPSTPDIAPDEAPQEPTDQSAPE